MSDEHLRTLEREDWRRWRVELVRLGRADEAGIATGDVVSVFVNPEQIFTGPRPYRALVTYCLDEGGDRSHSVVPSDRWVGFPEAWKDGLMNRPLHAGPGDGVKLLEVGDATEPRALVPPGHFGSQGLHDALVVHYRDHPLLGEKPLEKGYYRTSFDPREDCEWCSRGMVVVDLRRADQLGKWEMTYSPSELRILESVLRIKDFMPMTSPDPVRLDPLALGAMPPREQRRAQAAKKTRDNVRRRSPRRI